jgi:hypothetical protein
VTSEGKPITNNVFVTTRRDTTKDIKALAVELSKAVQRRKDLDIRPVAAREPIVG